MDLQAANIFYREPALYDAALSDDDQARMVTDLVDAYGPPHARTLLDLGCGTGRDLEHLADRFDCVGVDVLPGMVEYARQIRPTFDIRIGDMRSVRLGRTFDVIACLGYSLAYLHTNAELRAGFETFAAHAHADSALILYLPVAPPPLGEATTRARFPGRTAKIITEYEWDLRTQTMTMIRRWTFDDGEQVTDRIKRRVVGPRELELLLDMAGFKLVDMFNGPGDRDGDLRGPAAVAFARHTSA